MKYLSDSFVMDVTAKGMNNGVDEYMERGRGRENICVLT